MSLMGMLQILIPWVWGTASESAGLSSSQVRPRLLGPSCVQSGRDRAQAFCLVPEAAQSHSPPPPQREACAPAVWVCCGGTRARVPSSDPCPQTNLQSLPHSGPRGPSLESESQRCAPHPLALTIWDYRRPWSPCSPGGTGLPPLLGVSPSPTCSGPPTLPPGRRKKITAVSPEEP